MAGAVADAAIAAYGTASYGRVPKAPHDEGCDASRCQIGHCAVNVAQMSAGDASARFAFLNAHIGDINPWQRVGGGG